MTKYQKLIWYIGRHIKIIRYLYWRFSNHKWLWGVVSWLDDNYIADPKPCTIEDVREASGWLENHVNKIFQTKFR